MNSYKCTFGMFMFSKAMVRSHLCYFRIEAFNLLENSISILRIGLFTFHFIIVQILYFV